MSQLGELGQHPSFLRAARRGRSSFRSYLVGTFLIVSAYVVASGVAGLVLFLLAGSPADGALDLSSIDPTLALAVALSPSVVLLLAVAAVVRVVHGRPITTLVREGPLRWRRAAVAALLWGGLAAVFELSSYYAAPEHYSWSFEARSFFPLLVVALLLVPLQCAAEEVFFRAYLLQGLGIGLRRGWAALLLTSVGFGIVHGANPEVERFGPAFILYYVWVGLVLGAVTLFDDGLEIAIGAHTANNLYGALAVSFPESVLNTPALVRMEGMPPVMMAATGAATGMVFLLIMARMRHWRGLGSALGPVEPAVADAAALDPGGDGAARDEFSPRVE